MQNFADQCLDLARSILSQNLNSINEDGTINPVGEEESRIDEPGHAALAIGEYYRATNETTLNDIDLVDLAARCITAQAFTEEESENGLAYSALGLLSFGPSKERNLVWERLMEPTQKCLDKQLLMRTDYTNHQQAFNIAKSVARFSIGLSKKDETGKLIDKFLERLESHSSNGFADDHAEGLGGAFNLYGVMSFVFIRQALQLHSNIHLRERKLPSLRTHAEKYLKMFPDTVRKDGLGWCFGPGIGAYGQMHSISLILQALRDDWIVEEKKPLFLDILRRLFHYFFLTYLDQEHGFLIIRDDERDTIDRHTTRLANFDAARYLCQWARLSKSIGGSMAVPVTPAKTTSRFVSFDKSNKKEQGLFIYNDAESALNIQIPLISSGSFRTSDSLAFPHSPGIFDWPVNKYMPILLPELTFGDNVIIPSFYGKNCVTGLGLKKSYYFRYEQPELITVDEKIVPDLGQCKVCWTFAGKKITSEFIFTVKNTIQLDKLRYQVAIGLPHSHYRSDNSFTLGEDSLHVEVIKDDFQAAWQDIEVVSEDPAFRSYYGKLHYVQTLLRDRPLIMRPGQQYKLIISFEPDIITVE